MLSKRSSTHNLHPSHLYGQSSSSSSSNHNGSSKLGPKERKAAHRKEKSRVAAQIRRNKESQTLILLQNALPLALPNPAQTLEKSVVIRIAGQTLFLLNHLDQVLGTMSNITVPLLSQAFLGFFTDCSGQIVFVTPNIQSFLDQYHWSNLIGMSLYEVIDNKRVWPASGDIVNLRLSSSSSSASSSSSPPPSAASSSMTPATNNIHSAHLSTSEQNRLNRSQSFPSCHLSWNSHLPSASPTSSIASSTSPPSSSSSSSASSPTATRVPPTVATPSTGFFSTSHNKDPHPPPPPPPQPIHQFLNSRNILASKLESKPDSFYLLNQSSSNCSQCTVWCSSDITYTNGRLRLLLLVRPVNQSSSPVVNSLSLNHLATHEYRSSKIRSNIRTSSNNLLSASQRSKPAPLLNLISSAHDSDYNFHAVSNEFSEIVGFDKNHLKSSNFLDLIHLNDVGKIKSVLDSVINKSQNHVWSPVYRIICYDGRWCWIRTLAKQSFSSSKNQLLFFNHFIIKNCQSSSAIFTPIRQRSVSFNSAASASLSASSSSASYQFRATPHNLIHNHTPITKSFTTDPTLDITATSTTPTSHTYLFKRKYSSHEAIRNNYDNSIGDHSNDGVDQYIIGPRSKLQRQNIISINNNSSGFILNKVKSKNQSESSPFNNELQNKDYDPLLSLTTTKLSPNCITDNYDPHLSNTNVMPTRNKDPDKHPFSRSTKRNGTKSASLIVDMDLLNINNRKFGRQDKVALSFLDDQLHSSLCQDNESVNSVEHSSSLDSFAMTSPSPTAVANGDIGHDDDDDEDENRFLLLFDNSNNFLWDQHQLGCENRNSISNSNSKTNSNIDKKSLVNCDKEDTEEDEICDLYFMGKYPDVNILI